MNSLLLVGISLLLFVLAYRFYGRFLERIWDVSADRKTPVAEKQDGVDYIPAKHWTILFGHHFASIAGAGPILGPVIACMLWGWLPAAVWIICGSILLGGVHDFSSLVLSLRHKGRSVGEITESVMGRRSRILFSLFIWFTLILVVAVFASVTANTFVQEQAIVIPTFGLILISLLFGFLVYRLNCNYIYATLGALVLLAFLFVLGNKFPVSFTVAEPLKLWIIVLLVYSFIASIIPVNLLLQPRDYLSSFILIAGLVLGYAGLFTARPSVNAPAFIAFSAAGQKGTLWPMMFVIIACGAISGFHSLVASGTTSKQITSEKDARKISYGGMLTEGVLSILALLCVCAGLYWNNAGSALNYPELMAGGNWIGTFATGYGQVVSRILDPEVGKMLAIVMINAFVLTTLDTATRITRYISHELFGESWNIKIFRNRYFNTFSVVLIAGWLAFGNWQKIWPVFGAANQLVAAIALFVAGLFLLGRQKKSSLTAFLPALFMFLTTIAALVYQANGFYRSKNFLLGNIAILLTVLAAFVIVEGLRTIRSLKKS
ncbi:MAG: carbon starvation protein A [Candidatus Omnitrophica bacterium]|nr:carbon starvation protein A [Candidatus Omnitrophota bacterium]